METIGRVESRDGQELLCRTSSPRQSNQMDLRKSSRQCTCGADTQELAKWHIEACSNGFRGLPWMRYAFRCEELCIPASRQ